jgi:hypothetical protein
LELLVHYWKAIDKASVEFGADVLQTIGYRDLRSDPYEVVTNSLQALGYSLSEHDRATLRSLSEQGRQYKSQHRYSLIEFGLTRAQINDAFGGVDEGECMTHECQTTVTTSSSGCAGVP